MGIMDLHIPPNARICLDTAPVIYSVEKIVPYWELMIPLWESARKNDLQLVGSELLLLETLVKPLQQSNKRLETLFMKLLTTSDIQLEPISADILQLAAQLRATNKLKTPDAIHLATAIHLKSDFFITNDKRLATIKNIPVLVLNDYM